MVNEKCLPGRGCPIRHATNLARASLLAQSKRIPASDCYDRPQEARPVSRELAGDEHVDSLIARGQSRLVCTGGP